MAQKPKSPEAVTFTSLPLEIRREIYSYLLLDINAFKENAIECDGLFSGQVYLLEPQVATSLFMVNRKISLESLEYFYEENAFVRMTGSVPTLGYGDQLFPCFSWSDISLCSKSKDANIKSLSKVSLDIVLSYEDRSCNNMYFRGGTTMVFAARHLETMIRLINTGNATSTKCINIRVELRFFFDRAYYRGNEALADRLVNALKTWRTCFAGSCLPSLNLAVVGMIDDPRAKTLQNCILPTHEPEYHVKDAKWALEQGDVRSKYGEYNVAESYYSFATFFLHSSWPRASTMSMVEPIKLESNIRCALNFSKAQKHEFACKAAAAAFTMVERGEHGEASKEQLAHIYTKLGDVFASTGQYNREGNLDIAAVMFQKALENAADAPEIQDIQAKLEKAKNDMIQDGISADRHSFKFLIDPYLMDEEDSDDSSTHSVIL